MDTSKHLATFYRPQRFSELKGQEHIKKVLSRSSKERSIGKAYLFSGTRGVGKTSCARIFAKAINCLNGPGEEPCNQCDVCIEITNGTSLDVLEIDGASHPGVDNVRKLIEDISLAPIRCKYRVIIIDEVHMLSRSAFNALLKTLEEPPPHVVFILATTEVHKIPPTIISRCQHFTFKKLSTSDLANHLKDILDKENISYEEEALVILAKKGEGSVRDSLSMLSQVVTVGKDRITASLVREILGIVPSESKLKLIRHIGDRDIKSLISEIKFLLDQGIDIPYFLQEITMLLRDMFLIKSTGGSVVEHLSSITDIEEIKKLSEKFSLSQIHGAWQMVLDAQSRLDKMQDPVLFLELLFINLAYLPQIIPTQRANIQKEGQTKWERGETVSKSLRDKQIKSPTTKPSIGEENTLSPKENKKEVAPSNPTWDGFLKFLKKRDREKKISHITVCKPEFKGDLIEITCPEFWLSRLKSSKEGYELLNKLLKEYFGDIKIVFKPKGVGQTKDMLIKRATEDPIIKEVLKEFNGKIVDINQK